MTYWAIFEQLFASHAWLLPTMTGVFGLMVGSFINVVAHRTPIIMMNEWREEIADFISHDAQIDDDSKQKICNIYQHHQKLSLSTPRSSCPHCHHVIAWHHNIPIISYLLLLGRCASCHGKISPSYPAVELISALLSALIAYHFGVGMPLLLALIFAWFLLALSCIDIKVQLLPDRLLAPLGILGLLANIYGAFTTPSLAIWGLVVGFGCLWAINRLFRLFTRQDGMGLGDAKLLGVLGAWLGVASVPMIVFFAAGIGVIISIIFRQPQKQRFAFGPYLAIGGLISLLWGEQLWAWYWAGF